MKAFANGIHINYEVSGEGETITFVHALGIDLDSWWQEVEALEGAYRVLRFDVRGHGRSDKPAGPYTIALFADDLYGLLQALGVGRTHLVGLSMGGMIGQAFALAHPEMLHSLVLSDTSSGYTAEEAQVFEQRAALAEREGMEPIVLPTLERWFTAPFRASSPAVVERIARAIRANDPRAYAASCRAVGAMSLTERLSEIRCPTMVVVGEQDLGTTPEMARAIARRIPGARLELIPQAAHLVPVEKAAVFNALLRDFLARV